MDLLSEGHMFQGVTMEFLSKGHIFEGLTDGSFV